LSDLSFCVGIAISSFFGNVSMAGIEKNEKDERDTKSDSISKLIEKTYSNGNQI